MKKKIIAGILGITAVSAGVVAYGGGMMHNSALQDAASSGDYDTFIDELAAIDSVAAGRMTQERFEQMQGQMHRHLAVEDAIESGDYEAFIDATARQTTQEEFEDMVARHTAHDAIETAIEAVDYDAWVEAVQALPFGENIAEIVDRDEFESYIELRDEGGLGMGGPGSRMGAMKGNGMRGSGMAGCDDTTGGLGKARGGMRGLI